MQDRDSVVTNKKEGGEKNCCSCLCSPTKQLAIVFILYISFLYKTDIKNKKNLCSDMRECSKSLKTLWKAISDYTNGSCRRLSSTVHSGHRRVRPISVGSVVTVTLRTYHCERNHRQDDCLANTSSGSKDSKDKEQGVKKPRIRCVGGGGVDEGGRR